MNALLELKADVLSVNKRQETSFHAAIKVGSREIFGLLLQTLDASMFSPTASGLMNASFLDHPDLPNHLPTFRRILGEFAIKSDSREHFEFAESLLSKDNFMA